MVRLAYHGTFVDKAKTVDLASELLDRLDHQWASGSAANLRELLAAVPDSGCDLSQELCAADLEWRWRTAAAQSDESKDNDSFPAQPTADDYRPLLGQQWEAQGCAQNLMEAEWCARSIWGDSPHVDDFAARLPDLEAWHDKLGARLNALAPVEVTAEVVGRFDTADFRVGHDFAIGRQNLGEPDPPAWIESTRRLVVVQSRERRISRHQLRIRRTRFREIELTNTSKVKHQYGPEQRLVPGEVANLSLPTWIQLGDITLSVRLSEGLLV